MSEVWSLTVTLYVYTRRESRITMSVSVANRLPDRCRGKRHMRDVSLTHAVNA